MSLGRPAEVEGGERDWFVQWDKGLDRWGKETSLPDIGLLGSSFGLAWRLCDRWPGRGGRSTSPHRAALADDGPREPQDGGATSDRFVEGETASVRQSVLDAEAPRPPPCGCNLEGAGKSTRCVEPCRVLLGGQQD